jgi:hypothetical protein
LRGGFLHNEAMARQLKEALERLGARVRTEYPAGPGRRAGAVDLYIELHGFRIACEIELGPRRLRQDLRKAEALGVDLLLVVGPTPAVAKAILRRLVTFPKSNLKVRVLPNASVVSYLSKLSPVEGRGDKKTETPPAQRGRP